MNAYFKCVLLKFELQYDYGYNKITNNGNNGMVHGAEIAPAGIPS